MNILPLLFSTPERVRILNQILFRQDEFGVLEVSRECEVSKGLVSGYLRDLCREGLLDARGRKYAVRQTPTVHAIKRLLNLRRIPVEKIIRGHAGAIKGLGLFGSWASGTNNRDSDIDLWVSVEDHPGEMWAARLSKRIREVTSSEVNLILVTPPKLRSMQDTTLLTEMRRGVLLHGKGI